jgi:low affinity Fe/Cu permease
MNKIYSHTEILFEKLVSIATTILGNSISFLIALCLVLFWWINSLFTYNDVHLIIGDIIFGITFLSLFIIQKSFNRFSASLHLKVNELVSSHEPASNSVMNAEIKTEREITELSKEYSELAEQIIELEQEIKGGFNSELDKALDGEENHIKD